MYACMIGAFTGSARSRSAFLAARTNARFEWFFMSQRLANVISAHHDLLPQIPQVFWIAFDQRLEDLARRLPLAHRRILQQGRLGSFRRSLHRSLDRGPL